MQSLLSKAYELAFPRHAFERRYSKASREAELDLLPAVVHRDRTAIDVGANVGHYTLMLASLAKQVKAFEPNPRLARLLRKSVPSNVEVIQSALSNRSGRTELKVPLSHGREMGGLGSLEQVKGDQFRSFQVDVSVLDEIIKDDVGFIKIDVEGHENSVLEGADQLIGRCRPNLLIEAEERHRSGAVTQIFDYFRSRDYKGYFLYDDLIKSIDEFSVSTHQDQTAISANKQRYINNFLFVPFDFVLDDSALKRKRQ